MRVCVYTNIVPLWLFGVRGGARLHVVHVHVRAKNRGVLWICGLAGAPREILREIAHADRAGVAGRRIRVRSAARVLRVVVP